MSSFQINITHRCNLNCPFCYSIIKNENITKEIMDKSIEFIGNRMRLEPKDTPHLIGFSGGEIFSGSYELIPYAIKKLKSEYPEQVMEFNIQSNLTVVDLESNEIAKEIIDLVDMIGTSWDRCRFTNQSIETLYWKNIDYILKQNKKVEIIECITNDYIKEFGDNIKNRYYFWLKKGVYKMELSSLGKPMEDKGFYSAKPKNNISNEFLVKAYIAYKEVQKEYPEFEIDTFKSKEDAYNGIYHYECGRNCQRDMYTIRPDGWVGQCIITIKTPFYNVVTKELKYKVYEDVCNKEKELNPKCLECKYYKYCKGSCFNLVWDETDCPGAYKIFDVIEERNKSNE